MKKNGKIECEICGKKVPESKAHYINSGVYVCQECLENECVRCERCGDVICRDDAFRGYDGYLCECCYDELHG